MRIPTILARPLIACAVAIASLGVIADADAETKVTLKDGTVLRGDITREGEQFIILIVSIGEVEDQRFIRRSDIASIERTADGDGPDASDASDASPLDSGPVLSGREEAELPPGATRIAFISLEDTVGSHFNKEAIRRSVEHLKAMPEDRRPEVLVFRINSGGGALFELEKIVPYIQDEVEPEFRTVAWIESAISAACMTAWVIDEIYIMTKGAMGGNTAFSSGSSGTQAVEGRQLEDLLLWMEGVSRDGKKDPKVMRAMQVFATLSADIDDDGNVTWHLDDSGEHLVSPSLEVLTLNSVDAVRFGIVQGVADTKDQLAKAMGCNEWVEVGQEAEEMMVEFRDSVTTAQLELFALYREMQIALDAMNRTPDLRNKKRHFGKAKGHYEDMKVWAFRKAPSLLTYGQFVEPWFEQMDRYMDELAEQLRDA